MRVLRFLYLLKLYRPRRLTRQVIEYSVNPSDFIYDPAHHLIEHLVRNLRRLGCHEVNRLHGSQRYRVVISSFISR